MHAIWFFALPNAEITNSTPRIAGVEPQLVMLNALLCTALSNAMVAGEPAANPATPTLNNHFGGTAVRPEDELGTRTQSRGGVEAQLAMH